MNCQECPSSSNQYSGSPSHPPPYHRRSDHLPRLAEATSCPEDVVLVLVAAPIGVGSGSSASTVLCEGGGGIDLPDEQKKCCSKDVASLLRRMGPLDRSALFVKGLYGFPGSFRFNLFFPEFLVLFLDGLCARRIPSRV